MPKKTRHWVRLVWKKCPVYMEIVLSVIMSPIIDLFFGYQVNKTGTSEDDLDNSVQDLDQSVM